MGSDLWHAFNCILLSVIVILGKSHYLLYCLVTAIQPRMLVTFDEQLNPLPVSVRVGQVRRLLSLFLPHKWLYLEIDNDGGCIVVNHFGG